MSVNEFFIGLGVIMLFLGLLLVAMAIADDWIDDEED